MRYFCSRPKIPKVVDRRTRANKIQLNCTSQLNLAAAAHPKGFPAPPTGAITSNQVYIAALSNSSLEEFQAHQLPDFTYQVQEYIKISGQTKPKPTIFVVSFGFWDVYHFAGLEYTYGQNRTSEAIIDLFDQLDTLYEHYARVMTALPPPPAEGATNVTKVSTEEPKFQVVIPKLFDPTMSPGWITQRPVPLAPSSVAEEQKNGAYLANHWNVNMESAIKEWVQPRPQALDTDEDKFTQILKEIIFYDLPSYLLDLMVEQQLEEEGISDAAGMGDGESPFEDVSESCLVEGGEKCKEPEEFMFWDGFGLGSVAGEMVGKAVGEMVKEGRDAAKSIWHWGKP